MVAPLKKGFSLPQAQDYIARMVKERGFNEDLHREYILFSEECGELAKELRWIWEAEEKLLRKGTKAPAARLEALRSRRKEAASELADCFLYLANIATMLGVDLESAVIAKEKVNAKRSW